MYIKTLQKNILIKNKKYVFVKKKSKLGNSKKYIIFRIMCYLRSCNKNIFCKIDNGFLNNDLYIKRITSCIHNIIHVVALLIAHRYNELKINIYR